MKNEVANFDAIIALQKEQMKNYTTQIGLAEGANILLDKKQEALANTMEQNVKVLDAVFGNLNTDDPLTDIDVELFDNAMLQITNLTDALSNNLLDQLLPNSKSVFVQGPNSDVKAQKMTSKYVKRYIFGGKPELFQHSSEYQDQEDEDELYEMD